MASAYITMAQGGSVGRGLPVTRGTHVTQKITTSGTAATGTSVAVDGDIASIFCASAVIVSPVGTASQTNGRYVPASTIVDIGMSAGQQISIIDAT